VPPAVAAPASVARAAASAPKAVVKRPLPKPAPPKAAEPAALPPAPPEPAPAPAPRAQPAGPSSPEEACSDKGFLAKSGCIAEQCRRASFTQHPQCVQLRAIEQRKKDQEMLHN